MSKQYITNFFLGFLILLATFNVLSQEIHHLNGEINDSLMFLNVVPGSLFSGAEISNTGSVSTVSGETIYKTPVQNITNTVSGRLAGLMTSHGNGSPGFDWGGWYIRGIGTYAQSGSANTAKFFVDGFEVNWWDYLSYLAPAEISSISILKDAASLASFGMKGANGVVWVETKRGELSEPKINFQSRTGIQKAINIYKPLGSFEYASLYNQAVSNDNSMVWTQVYSNNQLNSYIDGTGTNIDWYDEVLKDNGYYYDADLSFHGGTNIVRYNVVLGYGNQQGLLNVSNTDQTSNINFSRYNMRTNLDIKLFQFLNASIDVGGRLENRNRPNYSIGNLMQDLARYPSNIYPIYDELAEDDLYNFSGTQIYPNNPVASSIGLGMQAERKRILQGNFKFKENLDFLAKGLCMEEAFSFYVMSTGGFSKYRNYARYFEGIRQTTDQSTSITASSLSADGMDQWMQGYVKLGHSNNYGYHSINSALCFFVSDYKGDDRFGYKNHSLNYNGKINYAYENRYIAEFGFSYFGSDAYAPGNQWGFYPAISAAWVVSGESFLESVNMVNFLKIRTSIGKTGGIESNASNGISSFSSNGRYLYQQYYSSSPVGTFYQGSGSNYSGQGTLTPLFVANEKVFAEKSIKYNAGIDLSLFRKLNFTFDIFVDKRNDILTVDNSLMNYYGRNIQFNNVGKMTNKGFEISTSYTDRKGDIIYTLYGTAFFAENTIDYMAEVTPAYPYNAQTGRAYGTHIGLEAIGYYQLSDFNADGSLKTDIPEPMFGAVQPGDLRYKDLDGNNYIDQTDVTKIGNPAYPKWSFSFGGDIVFKGFDFSLFFCGSAGASVNLLSYSSQMIAFVNNGNAYNWAKSAWAYYPEQGIDTRASATYPRLTTLENENNYRLSSFWIRKNDFIRLKNIELGYDFCNQIIKKSGISKFRWYVNASNLFTVSDLLKNYNMDPESGYGYPALKSYNTGFQIAF